jgi:putative selenate reductase
VGRRVAVVGGGNTAMDCARAALRVEGVEAVTVVYRRTLEEMPADREEYADCRREGAAFKFLTNPESLGAGAALVCRKMTLGEPDAGGRRSPMPTEDTEVLEADTVIAAIGEQADRKLLDALGLSLDVRGRPVVDPLTGETDRQGVFIGGDALTGPSTVARCIAEGRKLAEAICRKEFPGWKRHEKGSYEGPAFDLESQRRDVAAKKAKLSEAKSVAALGGDEAFAAREAERCLECNAICNKCVDVCPNRANVAVRVEPSDGMAGPYQILHLDSLCNECGNCGQFCPYTLRGRPYKDKLTLFSLNEDFVNSENSGFFFDGEKSDPDIKLRLEGRLYHLRLEKGQALPADGYGHDWNDTLAAVARVVATVHREYTYLLGPVSK